jgi:hypothetical protein
MTGTVVDGKGNPIPDIAIQLQLIEGSTTIVGGDRLLWGFQTTLSTTDTDTVVDSRVGATAKAGKMGILFMI